MASLQSARNVLAMTTLREQTSDYRQSVAGLHEGHQRYAAALEDCHRRGAERCLKLATANRGLYIKFGQLLASLYGGAGRSGCIPRQYVEALSTLLDRAPSEPFSKVAASVKEATQRSDRKAPAQSQGKMLQDPAQAVEEAASPTVRSIEPEPFASASIAQVHRALLWDGKKVAMKVQHPEVAAEAAEDIATFREMSEEIRFLTGLDLSWVIDDLERRLEAELDFEAEAENADLTAQLLRHAFPRVRVPRVVRELSSAKVLTADLIENLLKANDPAAVVAAGLVPEECAELICDAFAQMIFLHGRVHGDPHAGNVYLRNSSVGSKRPPQPQVVLLDHGLYYDLGSRDNGIRRDFCRLWKACCTQDSAEITRLTQRLVSGGPSPSCSSSSPAPSDDAGAAARLLPALLSPWFAVGCPGVSRDELVAAAEGRLPDSVALPDVVGLLAASRGSGAGFVGLLQALGYLRGLLAALGLPEKKRLAIMLKHATLGDVSSPPAEPSELSTGRQLWFQWSLGCLECKVHALAPLLRLSGGCCASSPAGAGVAAGSAEAEAEGAVAQADGDAKPCAPVPSFSSAAAAARGSVVVGGGALRSPGRGEAKKVAFAEDIEGKGGAETPSSAAAADAADALAAAGADADDATDIAAAGDAGAADADADAAGAASAAVAVGAADGRGHTEGEGAGAVAGGGEKEADAQPLAGRPAATASAAGEEGADPRPADLRQEGPPKVAIVPAEEDGDDDGGAEKEKDSGSSPRSKSEGGDGSKRLAQRRGTSFPKPRAADDQDASRQRSPAKASKEKGSAVDGQPRSGTKESKPSREEASGAAQTQSGSKESKASKESDGSAQPRSGSKESKASVGSKESRAPKEEAAGEALPTSGSKEAKASKESDGSAQPRSGSKESKASVGPKESKAPKEEAGQAKSGSKESKASREADGGAPPASASGSKESSKASKAGASPAEAPSKQMQEVKKKMQAAPKLTKEQARDLLDRGLAICEEPTNMKRLQAIVTKCKASFAEPSKQQNAIMQEVMPLAKELLADLLGEFGFSPERLTLVMLQVSAQTHGDERMEKKVRRLTKTLGLEF